MPENDANPLGDANDIRTQKRIELDNLVLDKIRIYNGLTLRQIEDLKITIPEGLRTEKRPDKKIERKFLINSLSRLEGKTGETPKIYSRYKEEPIHGKSIKEYFYGTQESDKTIITIPDTTELSKDLMKNPCAYVHDNETIGICDATQKEIVFDGPAIIPLQKLGEDVVETNNKNKFKLPHSIITFFNLETREWYFAKPKFTNKGMLLRIIAPKESKENPSTKKPKNILVLEDTPRYTEKLKRKFKKEKHNITYTNSLDKFTKIIEKDGKTFDVVSLDNNIKGELLAEKISALVRYHAPNAKLGLISGQIAEEEIKFFQDLGFDFFIKKRKTDDQDSKDTMSVDEFILWLGVV